MTTGNHTIDMKIAPIVIGIAHKMSFNFILTFFINLNNKYFYLKINSYQQYIGITLVVF